MRWAVLVFAKVTDVVIGIVILLLIWLIRSFGQWTEQLLVVHKNQKLILQTMKVFREPHPSMKDAVNHVAPFCAVDPPSDEKAS